MGKEKTERRKTGLESIREIILGSQESIKNELMETSGMNDWLHCFGNCVFAIELYLGTPEVQEGLGPENFQKMSQQLETLKERVTELRKNYPENKNVPQELPEKIQEELLASLRATGQDIL